MGLSGSWNGAWVLEVPGEGRAAAALDAGIPPGGDGMPAVPSFPLPQALPAVPSPLPSSHPVSVLPSLPRDEVQMRTAYSKSNGQPKSLGSAPPGPGQVPLSSPTRGGVKKVSGVGGTTYEISV